MEKKVAVIEYEVEKGTGKLTSMFNLDDDIWMNKWNDSLHKAKKSGDLGDAFIELLDQGFFSGSELMALAFAGFKEPHDMKELVLKLTLRNLGNPL